jgi:hypothetical protein
MFRGNCDRFAGKPTVIAGAIVFAFACGQGLSTPRAGADANPRGRMDSQAGSQPDVSGTGGSSTPQTSNDASNDAGDTINQPDLPSDAVLETNAPSPGTQMKQFSAAVGGDFDFGAGRFTITSNTFEGPVTITQSQVVPVRLGPVATTHEVSVSPRMKTKIPARIRLRIPEAWKGDASTLQLAYFKPKPSDPPGLWLVCNQAAPTEDERAIEGEAPPFDTGVEHFALLRRCSGSTGCEPSLFCLSGLCQ